MTNKYLVYFHYNKCEKCGRENKTPIIKVEKVVNLNFNRKSGDAEILNCGERIYIYAKDYNDLKKVIEKKLYG